MTLDLHSLELAISRLDESLRHCQSSPAIADASLARTIQAGAIQAFEFTYELCWKMLKRYLMASEPNPGEIEELSFADLIRLGNRRGLLQSEWETWRRYRKQRGTTSHTYDPRKAAEILVDLPGFLADAQHLLARLRDRAAAS